MDGSWRVWFQHGLMTSELDVKKRNIVSRDEALRIAEELFQEWSARV